LTRRERAIFEAFATGATTDEVAKRVRISSDDVRAHLRGLLQTLQARSKIEAVLLALAAGVIEEPQSLL
jgi:DNA-binding NarL/FixJ family response regulator